jgi:UMF1 family MFS transporter
VKEKWLTSKVFSWSLFDFANSTYAIIVAALVYQFYFKNVVTENSAVSDFYWALGINISMILTALLSPVLGAAADYYHSKKKYLLFFTLLCIISTGLLYYVEAGMIAVGLLLFILANTGFQSGLSFYDAFIREISVPDNYNKVSSLGYAVGYLGSLAALGAALAVRNDPPMSFVLCALLFAVFSVPMFLSLKETKPQGALPYINILKAGVSRVADTFKHIKSYSNLRNYLLSYFLYIDGINTVIYFTATFASGTFNFHIADLVMLFAIVQMTALAGSFLFGFVADRFGTKKTIMFNLIAWTCVTTLVFFNYDRSIYIVLVAIGGLFLGSTQALSRSLMSQLIPEEDKKTEFFGFYSLFEKTSTILGPLTFGLVSWLSGNQRYAVLSVSLFFLAGLLILIKVKPPFQTRRGERGEVFTCAQ